VRTMSNEPGSWNRRSVLRTCYAALTCLIFLNAQGLAAYPERPVRIICGSGAGGIVDITARIVADRMSAVLGKPVVVENMPAAGSTVAIRTVSRADADGYTLLLTGAGISVVPALYPTLQIDVINDLDPVSVIGDTPLVLFVHKSVPGNDYRSLVAYLKANPNKVSSGSNGRGTGSYLAMEFFKRLADIEVVNVYYKSTPQVIADLITGQIGMTFTAIGSDILHSPEIRPVGITALARSSAFQAVPTFSELGVEGFESGTPTMLLAPKGTPKEIIEALHNAVKAALADSGTQTRLDQIGIVRPAATGPEYARQFLQSEVTKWAEILRTAKD
jgi:tripartite-type tricarboxylate transporter receptor subunit TctC